MTKRITNQRGAALLETAITIPLILAVCISIFEFGRAYQTWQVLTNAAREGARIAILGETTDDKVTEAVTNYLTAGRLPADAIAATTINVERTVAFGSNTASRVTVNYPFNFRWLNPVVRLLNADSTTGQGTTNMQSSALMRNEG
jgi:Flp pilus assembly protein TadG